MPKQTKRGEKCKEHYLMVISRTEASCIVCGKVEPLPIPVFDVPPREEECSCACHNFNDPEWWCMGCLIVPHDIPSSPEKPDWEEEWDRILTNFRRIEVELKKLRAKLRSVVEEKV